MKVCRPLHMVRILKKPELVRRVHFKHLVNA